LVRIFDNTKLKSSFPNVGLNADEPRLSVRILDGKVDEWISLKQTIQNFFGREVQGSPQRRIRDYPKSRDVKNKGA
jgi:hypothetical protein